MLRINRHFPADRTVVLELEEIVIDHSMDVIHGKARWLLHLTSNIASVRLTLFHPENRFSKCLKCNR